MSDCRDDVCWTLSGFAGGLRDSFEFLIDSSALLACLCITSLAE